MPEIAQASSRSEVSPEMPTAPMTSPAALRMSTPPGLSRHVLDRFREVAVPAAESLGLTCVGAFNVAMVNDRECLAIWAIPDWPGWVRYERATGPGGVMRPWLDVLSESATILSRQLLVDAPLAPMRTGRQPLESDRRPLSDI